MKKILATILTFAMLLSMVTVSFAATADSDLVAYWNFDELDATDNSIADLSGNGNKLIVYDTDRKVVNGFSGKTFNFGVDANVNTYDSSKHMKMSSDIFAEQINGSEAITFSTFIKKEILGSSTVFTIFWLNAGNNSIYLQAGSNYLKSAVRSDASEAMVVTEASSVIYPNIDDGAATAEDRDAVDSPDSWMHVALVIDYKNDDVKIYADGVLVGREKAEATPQPFASEVAAYRTDVNDLDTGYFGIGGRHVLVDDFKVYKRALSEDEIKESIPPIMEYDFEEICGENNDTIKDLSTHGMDITIDSADTTAAVKVGAGINGSNTIELTKKAYFPADTFAGMFYGAKAYAISTWIKMPNGWSSAATAQAILNEETDATKTAAKGFSFSVKQQQLYLEMRSKNAKTSYDSIGYVMGKRVIGAYANTDWHHVYIEADFVNKTGKLYFDGKLITLHNDSVSNASQNYVTLTTDGLQDTFDIATTTTHLDNLKIYRRTLTDAEIMKEAGEPYTFSQTENSVTANCNLANIDGLAAGSQLILAMYDTTTKQLKDIAMTRVDAITDTIEKLTIDEIDTPANYTYKLFIWKSLASLAPVQGEDSYTYTAAQ